MRAEKATKGPWEYTAGGDVGTTWKHPEHDCCIHLCDLPLCPEGRADGLHIAGASPDVILALVQIIERQAEDMNWFQDEAYPAIVKRRAWVAIEEVEAIAAKIEKEIG